ncbi:hypothetical protein ACW2Q0_30660 [Nocardia sp. R16R-3T]
MEILQSNTANSLAAAVEDAGGPLNLLRGSSVGAFVFPHVAPEYTNWRDEMRSWRNHVALVDMSYHMTELDIRGADGIALLSNLVTNKLDPYPVMRAKQLIFTRQDGYLIGDVIGFRESEDHIRLIGAPQAIHWVQYNAEKSGMDVEATCRESQYGRNGTPEEFRIQVQGPNTLAMMQEVADGDLPDVKFFNIAEFEIAGRPVRALRHGMAGEAGFEIYGSWQFKADVLAAIEEAGAQYGLRKVGFMAMTTPSQESGWMPMPLAAIYENSEMQLYREWLGNDSLEAIGSLGGSFFSDDIRDYYVDPVEIGYKSLIDLDHDFVGRDSVRARIDGQKRKKVTLEWNNGDVMACVASALTDPGNGALYMKLPNPMYATFQSDAIMKKGKQIGISQCLSFSTNANRLISPAIVDLEYAEAGTEVTVLWGEPNSTRPGVDKHQIREIRGTIAPSPYFEMVNKTRSR